MVEGRSKAVFKTWLADRPQSWRDGIEVVAMDGFTVFKAAAAEEVPAAVEVMDPFHVVKLVGDGLDEVRRRVQQETTGYRGKKGDPLYQARWFLLGSPLLNELYARLDGPGSFVMRLSGDSVLGRQHALVRVDVGEVKGNLT